MPARMTAGISAPQSATAPSLPPKDMEHSGAVRNEAVELESVDDYLGK